MPLAMMTNAPTSVESPDPLANQVAAGFTIKEFIRQAQLGTSATIAKIPRSTWTWDSQALAADLELAGSDRPNLNRRMHAFVGRSFVLDQPIADFSVFPTLLVARMARSRVTVALGGDGGDELFAGYDAYQADRYSTRLLDWLPRPLRANIERLARFVPLGSEKRGVGNQVRRFLEGAAMPVPWQHMRWMIFLNERSRARLYSPEFRAQIPEQTAELVQAGLEDAATSDRLASQMRCDLRLYLAENILPKVDAMSMASSLEARSAMTPRAIARSS